MKQSSVLCEKIVSELSSNARISFRTLAKRVKVSPSTVIQCVKRLEREGRILGYSAVLDYERLGYDLTALIGLTIGNGALLKVQKEIARFPEVVSVYDITGEFDSMVVVRVRNRRELSKVVKRILALEHVERTNTHLVLNTVKENYKLLD